MAPLAKRVELQETEENPPISLSPSHTPSPISLFLFAMSVPYFSSQKQIMIEQEEVPRIVAWKTVFHRAHG